VRRSIESILLKARESVECGESRGKKGKIPRDEETVRDEHRTDETSWTNVWL